MAFGLEVWVLPSPHVWGGGGADLERTGKQPPEPATAGFDIRRGSSSLHTSNSLSPVVRLNISMCFAHAWVALRPAKN